MKVTDSKHRLLELMALTGDSQNDISQKSSIPKSSISHYVNGEREPRQDKISQIADAYNINPAWLLGYDVEIEIDSSRTRPSVLEAYMKSSPEIRSAVNKLLDIGGENDH